jgi:dUTP pyrophosphatase
MTHIIEAAITITDPRMTPRYATQGSAAFDLQAGGQLPLRGVLMAPGQVVRFYTGITLALPDGYCAWILPRSGLGTAGLVLANGTGLIDPDYRGEISVALWNRSDSSMRVLSLDRIAQLVVVPFVRVAGVPVGDAVRGDGGFGSTGVATCNPLP